MVLFDEELALEVLLEAVPDVVDEVEDDGVELPDGLLLEELLDEVVDEPPVEGELEVLPLDVLLLEVLLLEVFDGAELLLPFFEEPSSGSVAGLLGASLETSSEDWLLEALLPAILLVDSVSVGLSPDGLF